MGQPEDFSPKADSSGADVTAVPPRHRAQQPQEEEDKSRKSLISGFYWKLQIIIAIIGFIICLIVALTVLLMAIGMIGYGDTVNKNIKNLKLKVQVPVITVQ